MPTEPVAHVGTTKTPSTERIARPVTVALDGIGDELSAHTTMGRRVPVGHAVEIESGIHRWAPNSTRH